MPTSFTHPAVPLAFGLALGSKRIPPRLLAAGVLASVAPDLDVISLHLGVARGGEFAHRGASHSLLAALALALVFAVLYRWYRAGFLTSFLFLFVAAASHATLDAFTNGGPGVAFFWPWSGARFFLSPQVIKVSPLSLTGLRTPRGAQVLLSELVWVWLPLMAAAILCAALRRLKGGCAQKTYSHGK